MKKLLINFAMRRIAVSIHSPTRRKKTLNHLLMKNVRRQPHTEAYRQEKHGLKDFVRSLVVTT